MRLKGESSKRIGVPTAVNNPSAEQNPDEVGVCNICGTDGVTRAKTDA